MSVIFEIGYSDFVEPLTNARIAHAKNWFTGGKVVTNSTAVGYSADAPNSTMTFSKWKAAQESTLTVDTDDAPYSFPPASDIEEVDSGGAASRLLDVAFQVEVVLPIAPTDSYIVELGGGSSGVWLGVRDSGTYLRFRAGDGLESFSGGATPVATDISYCDILISTIAEYFDGNAHKIAIDCTVGNPSVCRVFIDGFLAGTGGSSGDFGQWAGSNVGNYLKSSASVPSGEPDEVWCGGTTDAGDLYLFTDQIFDFTTMTTQAIWGLEFPAANPKYCCIAGHNFADCPDCVLDIEYYDAPNWVSVSTIPSPDDNSPIFVLFDEKRFDNWRLVFDSPTKTFPEISVVKFGDPLEMEVPIFGGVDMPLLANNIVHRSVKESTGEYLGRAKKRKFVSTSFSWEHLTAAWVRTNWAPFQIAAEAEPFFIAWRPISVDDGQKYKDVIYGQTNASPKPENMGINDKMAVTLEIEGLSYD